MILSARTGANQPISTVKDEGSDASPQLIISSATLRNHLKKYVMVEKGWIRSNRMVRVSGTGLEFDPVEDGERDKKGVTHSALVIMNDGRVRDMYSAIPLGQS